MLFHFLIHSKVVFFTCFLALIKTGSFFKMMLGYRGIHIFAILINVSVKCLAVILVLFLLRFFLKVLNSFHFASFFYSIKGSFVFLALNFLYHWLMVTATRVFVYFPVKTYED